MNTIFNFHTKSIRLHPNGFSLFKKKNGLLENRELLFTSSLIFSDVIRTFFDDESGETPRAIVDLTSPILIPRMLYDENAASEYLKLHFDLNDPADIYKDELEDYYCIYFIPKKINVIFNRSGIDLKMISQFTLMYQELQKKENDNALGIFIDKEFVDYLLIKEGKLQLLNRFNYASENDILYFIMNLLKQYQLSKIEISLYDVHHPKVEKLLANYFDITT